MTGTVDLTQFKPGIDLQQIIERFQVPGISVSILLEGQVFAGTAGVLDCATAQSVSIDASFQIGSITKAFTATLIMMLVADNQIDIDLPICTYLPEFDLSDHKAANQITVRHLLCHTSGMDGDAFITDKEGVLAGEGLYDQLLSLRQLNPPGQRFSYCNIGYIVAGRLIEHLTGLTWDQAVRERIFDPLKMNSATTSAEEMKDRRFAHGHVMDRCSTEWNVSTNLYCLSLEGKAAGTTMAMSALDLLKFAQLHLNHGVTESDLCLLPKELIGAMQNIQAGLPKFAPESTVGWGLGWAIYDWSGHQVFGHDGDTLGQMAFLRIDPTNQTAMVILTNGGRAIDLAEDLFAHVYPRSVMSKNSEGQVNANTCGLSKSSIYLGGYARWGAGLRILRQGQSLAIEVQETHSTDSEKSGPYELVPVETHVFMYRRPGRSTPIYVQFDDFDKEGIPISLISGYRVFKKEYI